MERVLCSISGHEIVGHLKSCLSVFEALVTCWHHARSIGTDEQSRLMPSSTERSCSEGEGQTREPYLNLGTRRPV